MKPSELVPHRTSEELEHAYRQAERPVERSRWHLLWLKSKGKMILELIEVTGFSRTTISTLIRRYNAEGVDAVLDRRQFNGAAPALNEAQQETLFLAIRDTLPDSGLWTSQKVRRYIQETFSIEVTDVCAWGYLRRLGFSVQMPRPKNAKAASPEEQGVFIKKIAGALRIAQAAYPDKECALWIQDEGRFGLKPILKRQWALQGQRPIIEQTRKYQWLYAYIFVEPETGKSEYLLLPTVNILWMQAALKSFSEAVDPEKKKLIVLVLDQAGWHMSKKLEVPSNILLMPLPAYTPELSPAEPMVNKLKIPLANKTLKTLKEVEDLLANECVRLKENW